MNVGLDIVGRRIGRLEVVELLPPTFRERSSGKRVRVLRYSCRCTCGQQVEVERGNLTQAHTLSCGCLKRRRGGDNPGWRGHGRISGYFWAHIRSHAKRASRELAFTITMADAWAQFEKQQGRCALTGWPLTIDHSSHGGPSTKTASLDRIDSRLGYEPGNIQWVHKDVNQMKWHLSNDRFIEVCRAVVANSGAT